MHEAALMKDLMKKILEVSQSEGGKRVLGIKVRLGALSHMSPEHFLEHFEQESRGTPAEGARVRAETTSDIRDPNAREILLESVDVEA